MPEYHTARFPNDAEGIRNKNAFTTNMAAQGWRIASELIEQGHIKGGEACCGATICLPLAFLAGRTPSVVTVTFVRETMGFAPLACSTCGQPLSAESKFCTRCGAPVAASSRMPDTALGRNAPPSEVSIQRCRRCSAPVGGGVLYCYDCRCRRCEAAAAEGSAYCNECSSGMQLPSPD